MAEPARRLDDEPDKKQVYDTSGTEPSDPRAQLKALEGGGETTEPKRGHLKLADDTQDIAGQENNPVASTRHENQVGLGYQKAQASRFSLKYLAANRKRSYMLGGGVIALIITVLIITFIALLPLKILHIVNNLQSHFYASAENATERETDKLFSEYIKKYYLPALRNCPGSVTRDCNPIPVTQNPVSRLYKGWRNARLEDKLAKNYGIEFKYSGGNYYMKVPEVPKDVNINGFVNDKPETIDQFISSSSDFKGMSRGEIRQAVKDATSNETKWKRVMYRYKVGRLLEEKYGIRRCIIFCSARDALADNVQAQKNAAKLYLTERVIQPRDESLAIVLTCFFNPDCHPTDTTPSSSKDIPCETGVDCSINGAPENKDTDKVMRTTLEELASTYGIKDATQLTAMYAEIEEVGFNKFIIKYVMEKVFGVAISDATVESLSKAIPLIGWVNLAFQLVQETSTANVKLKKLSYLANAPAAVSIFGMYRTYADEIKTGNVNAQEVGSLVDSLGPVATNNNLKDLVGGTAEAEETPLYQTLINNKTANGTSNYKCGDGKPIATGQQICPEEKLAIDSSFLAGLKEFLDSSGLTKIASYWNGTIGKLLGFVGNIIGWLTSSILQRADSILCIKVLGVYINPAGAAYCEARDAIAAATEKIINYATSQLIPSPFGTNMSGGRTFDMVAAGADVSGNDFAHNGLGGEVLSNDQVAYIRSRQQYAELQNYQRQNVIARLFDTQSEYSPVTKLALAMPNSVNNLQTGVANLFAHPLNIFSGLGSIFHSARASAAANLPDAFGVTQYGYPENDPQVQAFFSQDHEDYWNKYCDPKSPNYITDQWNQDASLPSNVDPNTGMPMNRTFNGCLLIQSSVGSDGAVFDNDLLTADDLADNSVGSTSSDNGGATTTAGATIDIAHLFDPSVNVACAPGTKDLGIQDGYHNGLKVQVRICAIPGFVQLNNSLSNFGVDGTDGNIAVNSRVSGAVLAMFNAAKQTGLTLQANSSFRTMAYQQSLCPCDGVRVAIPGYSNHQMGLAIDIAGLPPTPGPVSNSSIWDWLSNNAANFGYKNYPEEAWHWSPTGN